MIDTEIKVTPQIAAEHGLTPDEYARIQKILGRDPNLTELGHFQRDVERALLVQIVARPSEAAADARDARGARAGRERGRGGHRRRARRRLQDRVAQSSELRRAVSGRGDGRGRNPARHFHDGRAADCGARFAAVRADRRRGPARRERERRGDRAEPADSRRRGARYRILRQLLRRADRRRRSDVRAVLFE